MNVRNCLSVVSLLIAILLFTNSASAQGSDNHAAAQAAIINHLLGKAAAASPDSNTDGRVDSGDVVTENQVAILYRVRCGGNSFTDSLGDVWQADTGFFNTGNSFTSSNAIAGTTDDPLYQTERYAPAGGTLMEYNFPVAPGLFVVRLHFAETTYSSAGSRVFDVSLEGDKVLTNFDIAAQAGPNNALVKELSTFVRDGELSIRFHNVIENPKISAIEIVEYGYTDLNRKSIVRIMGTQSEYTDPLGRVWTGDAAYVFSNSSTVYQPINVQGTNLDPAYHVMRFAPAGTPALEYRIPVAPGAYSVRLHLADFENSAPNVRSSNVFLEGQFVLGALDAAAKRGQNGSYCVELNTTCTDGTLNISVEQLLGRPAVNAIEVLEQTRDALTVTPTLLQWPVVAPGTISETYGIILRNNSNLPVHLNYLTFEMIQGRGYDFFVFLNGVPYAGWDDDFTYNVDVTIPAYDYLYVPVYVNARVESQNVCVLHFRGNFPEKEVVMASTISSDSGHGGHPYLHVVINVPSAVVDYDGNGVAPVSFDGSQSHTHQFGHALIGYEWRNESNAIFSTQPTFNYNFPTGEHTVSLTIYDDNAPSDHLKGEKTFTVLGPDSVPGALALYYVNRSAAPEQMLDEVPANADFAERSAGLAIGAAGGLVGTSPYSGDIMVAMHANVRIDAAGNFVFQANGGSDNRLFINGVPASGAVALGVGTVEVEARFAINSVSQIPISVTYAREGDPQIAIAEKLITHNESEMKPVINTYPEEGNPLGNEAIHFTGLGFFPEDQVKLHWGDIVYTASQLGVTAERINFVTPAGTGLITVYVETPNGNSNAVFFEYTDTAAVPVNFNLSDLAACVDGTAAAWGPDGRLYVGKLDGYIIAFSFDDDYNVTGSQVISPLFLSESSNILGIGFNPLDGADPVKIYVAHGTLYANGGTCFSGFSPYSGKITIISGPNFDTAQTLISNLPVSNHDHGINQLTFDQKGDLYFGIGGCTNGGVPGCNLGGLPESPLSAAIIKAETSNPSFNGAIQYVFTSNGQPSGNQVDGGAVDVAAGSHVRVFGAGLRNPFDTIYTTTGRIYCVDNGPDPGFGAFSTGPTSSITEYDAPDELNYIVDGGYYGHPNRNRGRYDARQNVFHDSNGAGNASFTQAIGKYPYSTNGLMEYRANTFNGAMRGELIAQVWNGSTFRHELSADGASLTSTVGFPVQMACLDILQGPGGVVIGVDYTNDKLKIARPVDPSATGLKIFDIFPWQARTSGGTPFVIGGVGFGTIANTSVRIGGLPALLTSVSSTRIRGIIPARPGAPADLQSVVVSVGSNTTSLSNAFQYAGNTSVDTGARVTLEIDTGGSILPSSTYASNSFRLINSSTGGQKITKVTYDLRTAIMPDAVFDPFANAGDSVGKDFTIDANNVGGSIVRNFASPHDGGFDILTVDFNSFDPGNNIGFSLDCDPTTINNAPPPGPNDSGSVSGLEISGCTITTEFDDGTILIAKPFRKLNSSVASRNIAKPGLPPTPQLQVLEIPTLPATVTNPGVTCRVSGPAGSQVTLMHAELGLYLSTVPGGGFDVDPYEANNIINVNEYTATVGASNFVDIPVTLRKSSGESGYNYLTAVFKDPSADNGDFSQLVIIKLE